jgi:hypothetical protein
LRTQLQGRDGLDGLALGAAHYRNADFEFRHAGSSQCACDGEFFPDTERNPGGLLAVAQRGVVDDDRGSGHDRRPMRASAGSSQAVCQPLIFNNLL